MGDFYLTTHTHKHRSTFRGSGDLSDLQNVKDDDDLSYQLRRDFVGKTQDSARRCAVSESKDNLTRVASTITKTAVLVIDTLIGAKVDDSKCDHKLDEAEAELMQICLATIENIKQASKCCVRVSAITFECSKSLTPQCHTY